MEKLKQKRGIKFEQILIGNWTFISTWYV